MRSPQTAAFFDVDGTLASSNVLLVLLDLQRSRLQGLRWWTWLVGFALRAPYYGLLDLVDRRAFNTRFARNYRGVGLNEVQTWQQAAAARFWGRRLFPQAAAQVQQHKAQGHLVVIVSGGITPMLEPLAKELGVDALYAARPELAQGRFTGRLLGILPVNEGKVAALQEAATALGASLELSYAYGDHYGDRFFLQAVGHPAAVNPNPRLRALATSRGWPIHRWRT